MYNVLDQPRPNRLKFLPTVYWKFLRKNNFTVFVDLLATSKL